MKQAKMERINNMGIKKIVIVVTLNRFENGSTIKYPRWFFMYFPAIVTM